MPAILVISCIDDEVTFVDGVRENSINPSEVAPCPSLLTSSAICMTAGFGLSISLLAVDEKTIIIDDMDSVIDTTILNIYFIQYTLYWSD
jgi:hypothetical protein